MSAETIESYAVLDQRLKKALKISLGLHIAVFLFFTVKFYLIPDDVLDYESSLRVDIVALPQKDVQQMIEASPAPPEPAPAKPQPKAPSKPEPKKQAAPEEVVVLNPKKKDKTDKKIDTEKKQKEALNRLKQMSALENLENQVKNERKAAPTKPVFAGNQIATGSDLRGLSKIQHDSYVAQVERHIRQNWALPQWLANKKLRAQVRVKIDSNGQLISKSLVRSSGNSSFDDVALETIEKSTPVPRPPDKLVGLLANEGILFGFPD